MVVVRQMVPEDASEVSALVTQLGYQRTAGQVEQWIARMEPSRQIAYAAVIDREVVGWIEVELVHHVQSEPHVLIGGLVVKDGVRGLGVGRRLCEQAEAWAWELGVSVVRVTSRSTRLDAHRFYLRDGYRLDKTSFVFEKRRDA